MILSVTSLKGGVGKSTIALNLSVAFQRMGLRVCLVDTDNNRSMLTWHMVRTENHKLDKSEPKPIPAFELPSDKKQIPTVLDSLNDAYDVIVIDGTPHMDSIQKYIIASSQLVVVPYTTGTIDLWALQRFLQLYEDCEFQANRSIPSLYVLNKFDPKTLHDRESREWLVEHQVPLADTSLYNRPAAYKDIVGEGKGVLEGQNRKAIEEFQRLFKEVCGQLYTLGLLDDPNQPVEKSLQEA